VQKTFDCRDNLTAKALDSAAIGRLVSVPSEASRCQREGARLRRMTTGGNEHRNFSCPNRRTNGKPWQPAISTTPAKAAS